MAEKKITKKDNFMALIDIVSALGRDDLVQFCEHEIELITKKKSSSANTAKKQEQETVKAEILKTLNEIDNYARIIEITKHNENLSDCSNQKISAMLSQLIAEGKVTKKKEKGVVTFLAL